MKVSKGNHLTSTLKLITSVNLTTTRSFHLVKHDYGMWEKGRRIMNANCEKTLVEEVLNAINREKSIEITSDEKHIHVKSTYTHNGNWICKSINKEDGKSEGFSTNCACF